MLPRKILNALVQRTPHDAEAVHHINLRSEHGDLVDVLDEGVIAVFAVDVIEQRLRCNLRLCFCRND